MKEVLKLEGSIYVVEINKKMWINAINLNCNVRFINHGCINNNCELVKLSETVVGILLIKNVTANTFFSYNYGLCYYHNKKIPN